MQLTCGDVGVMGLYTFELNGKRVFECPSKNLITDFGWNRLSNLGDAPTSGSVVQVGSSNTPPALSDTTLGAFLAQQAGAGSQTQATGTDGVGIYTESTVAYAFAQGAVIGNVAEVGFKFNTADAGLTSRSLVKDGLGNPAVIVCTAIDQLTVNYTLRYYRPNFDVTGSVTVAGVPTTYIVRAAQLVAGTSSNSSYFGGLSLEVLNTFNHYGTGSTLGAAGSAVSGSITTVSTGATVVSKVITVNPTNTVVTFSTPVIATAVGNSAGGVLNLQFNPASSTGTTLLGAYGVVKANFSPAIPKDNTKTLQYSFSFTFNRL